MKKIILFTFLLLSGMAAKAQVLNSISHFPSPAATNDQVKIVLNTTFPNNCVSDSFAVVISGNQVQIYMYQCLGMLQIICNKNDTVNIGQLPQGTYTVYVFISAIQANPSCSPYPPPTPQNQIYTFIVNQATSTGQIIDPSSPFSIFPNPSAGDVHVALGPPITGPCELQVSDISGKLTRSYLIQAGMNECIIRKDELVKGMYFVRIVNGTSVSHPQKLLIAD